MNKNTIIVKTKNSTPWLFILGCILVLLKAVGYGPVATWPWLWVLSPFWLPWAIIFGLILIFLLVGFLIKIAIAVLEYFSK